MSPVGVFHHISGAGLCIIFCRSFPPHVLEVKLSGFSVGVLGGNPPPSFREESSPSFGGESSPDYFRLRGFAFRGSREGAPIGVGPCITWHSSCRSVGCGEGASTSILPLPSGEDARTSHNSRLPATARARVFPPPFGVPSRDGFFEVSALWGPASLGWSLLTLGACTWLLGSVWVLLVLLFGTSCLVSALRFRPLGSVWVVLGFVWVPPRYPPPTLTPHTHKPRTSTKLG